MNCKPGDIAVSIGSRNAGRIMKVLYACPPHRHLLPNGNMAQAPGEASWVVELIDGNMAVKFTTGITHIVNVGVAWDRCIKPLRDPDEGIEVDDELCFELPKICEQGKT